MALNLDLIIQLSGFASWEGGRAQRAPAQDPKPQILNQPLKLRGRLKFSR
jgi:hypothetical protein